MYFEISAVGMQQTQLLLEPCMQVLAPLPDGKGVSPGPEGRAHLVNVDAAFGDGMACRVRGNKGYLRSTFRHCQQGTPDVLTEYQILGALIFHQPIMCVAILHDSNPCAGKTIGIIPGRLGRGRIDRVYYKIER